MNEKDYAKKIALGTCIYFTAFTFFILLLFFIINLNLSTAMKPLTLITILAFALMFSVANIIYRHTELKIGWKALIHYVLTVGGAFVCLYLPNKTDQQKASGAVLLFLIFTVIYFLIMGTIWTISSRIKRVKRDESKYQKVYKK